MPGEQPGRQLQIAAIAGALALSALLIWFFTNEKTVTLTYVGGLAVLGTAAFFLSHSRPAKAGDALALPDWSITLAAIEQPGVAVVIMDRANRVTCASSAYVEAFGVGHPPTSLAAENDGGDLLIRLARSAWRDGKAVLEDQMLGGTRWHVSAARAGLSDDYLVWRLTPVFEGDPLTEIGARITGPFGKVLSHAGIEVALVGPEGAICSVNPGFAERAAGDAQASLVGQEFVSLLHSDKNDRIFFAREGSKGSAQRLIHIPLGDPDADRRSDDDHAPALMVLLDAGVGIGGGWGSDSQAGAPQVRALLEQLALGLAMTDRDGHFLFANPAFMRASGLETRSLPPYPSDLVVREDKGALSDAVRRYGQGAATAGDMAIRLRGNPDESITLGLAGVRGLGEPAVLLSLIDTTEEARLKRQVAQATKMQAVGQLAGGVAHDFNNVLTAIIGYCDLMLLRHTPGDSDYDDIQQIRANSNRAASLTRQLLAFSRQQTLRPEVLQLPDVVSEVSQLLKRLMGEKIEFKVHHDRNLGAVRADPQQLEQVIVNLAVNARDAMLARGGASGRLTMATRRVTSADIRRMKNDIIPIGDYTAMIVEDTGGGIPPENIGKIFEPFFTTKELGKGTGLGLSTVYGIVKQSGGFIFADNALDENSAPTGARFTMYLPVHHEAQPAIIKMKPEAEKIAWSGGGSILLVEDEDMVRAVAERALTRQGYSVTTASDGEEGLERVQQGGVFDMVVSDVVMPTMDGPAMARELRKIAPRLPVLFMSGYAEEQLRNEIDIENMHFLPKPFSVQQIASKVAEVLSSSGKAAG